jgi:hypothetical protein
LFGRENEQNDNCKLDRLQLLYGAVSVGIVRFREIVEDPGGAVSVRTIRFRERL